MDFHPQVQVNVPPPSSPSQTTKFRPLSADEALQFTPFTTPILPAYDRIPIPQIARVRETGPVASQLEKKHAQQFSGRAQNQAVKERLGTLLTADSLNEYKFILPPSRSRSSNAMAQPKPADLGLSPLALAVYNMSSVDYRYPSPPASTSAADSVEKPQINHLRTSLTPAQTISPEQRVQSSTTSSFPQSKSFKSPASAPLVQIPKPASNFTREDFAAAPDSPKRRKLSHDDQDDSLRRSQIQVQQHALSELGDILTEVFDAHDAGNTDGTYISAYFDSAEGDDESLLHLSLSILDKLQSHLRKVVGFSRLADIPQDHLRRLQQLCEPSIERARSLNLRLSPDASDDDRSDWRVNVSKAQNGVAASIAFLYTMIGCPHDEALLTSDAHPYVPAVLTNVFENCIIPIIEVRPDDAGASELFTTASTFKDDLRRLLDLSRKLLDLIATACVDVKGSEIYVNTVEFLAAKLIFLQNAPSEKSSALGLQAGEKLRKSAMSVLARLYTRFPQERSAILDEVLTSLDKLQSSKRNAQHHRLTDGSNIQLITVLFMQLVQTTSIETGRSSKNDTALPNKNVARNGNPSEDDEDDEEEAALDAEYSSPFLRLQDKVDKLFNPAAKSAQDIVAWLVSRASNTTKTGDSPYRTILDNFVKDLILALPDMEWPAAEMLLRVLAARMLDIVANDKSASAKNMALEQLGEMGAAISKLRISASVSKSRLSTDLSDDGESTGLLRSCIESQAQTGAVPADDLISLQGPFAIVVNHLFDAASSTNLSRQSACSYFLAHYAKLVTLTASSDAIDGSKIGGVMEEILRMLSDPVGYSRFNDSFSDDEVRHAYLLCVLNLGFCRRLHEMIRVQIEYARIEQPQLRARSIKSLQRVLEADPSPIERDGQLVDVIFQRANDESGLVRDAALSILANLMVPREALRRKAIKRLLECAEDSKVGVTKRAIGYLKDIYFGDNDPVLKALIARKILQRFNDHEDSIANTAKQTLQDIWLAPNMKILQKDETSAEAIVAIEGLAEHLVKCVTVSAGDLSSLLKSFFVYSLRKESRAETSITALCMRLTDVFFEKTIAGDNNQAVLELLTAMSEADPKLVKPQQLSKLQNYLSDIKTENDLFMFRSVVRIFCNVLPDISKTHEDMLRKIQNALMNAVGKLGRRAELDMVMKCLRTLDTVLRNTERLVRLTVSCVDQLPRPNINIPSLQKLLRILGAVGKYIDFDERPQLFAEKLKAAKAHTVAGYIAAAVHRLTMADRPSEIRLTAFETLGAICQAAPAEFGHAQVKSTFFKPLMQAPGEQTTDTAALRTIVLRILEELYTARAQEKDKSDKSADSAEKQELKQMGGSSRTRDHDSAISSITPEIVDHALRIALADTSDDALLATKMLSSISHQGLVHPKQILGAFVALGTSQRTEIAEVSHAAQALLHEQHESHCEREYMTAVVQAFEYQMTVAHDATGATQPGNRAKLSKCFEIVATSSSKYIKKFLSGLVSRITIDFLDIQQMIVALDKPLLTRFIVQNIAFADYKKVDELLHVTLQLELAYGKGGTELAAAIEASQQAHPDIAIASEAIVNGTTESMPAVEVSKTRDPALVLDMKRFGPAAANLLLLIEARAHLIRQYALARDIRATLTNNKKEKTGDKAPSKTIGITGERFWRKSNEIISALEAEEATIKLCEEFVAAVNVDDDFDLMIDETEPSAEVQDFANYAKASTPGGRKRKLAANSSGTPSKRAKGRPRKSETRRSSSISSRDDPDDAYVE